jgi:hypothetical protein
MRYERPMIVRRERIQGLLVDIISKSDADGTPVRSDIARKERIVPVTWDEPRDRLQYDPPSIEQRERIQGLLDTISKSDRDTGAATSDIARKERIVPVTWAEPRDRLQYDPPSIEQRERIQGLLEIIRKSDQDSDVFSSDIARKEHVVPVTWAEPRGRLQYDPPSIEQREQIKGLLSAVAKSDRDTQVASDIARKEHIVPVTW